MMEAPSSESAHHEWKADEDSLAATLSELPRAQSAKVVVVRGSLPEPQ